MSKSKPPASAEPAELNELSYEQAYAELEAVVSALENEQQPLEQVLALYARAQALSRRCAGLLDGAELKLRQLNGADA